MGVFNLRRSYKKTNWFFNYVDYRKEYLDKYMPVK